MWDQTAPDLYCSELENMNFTFTECYTRLLSHIVETYKKIEHWSSNAPEFTQNLNIAAHITHDFKKWVPVLQYHELFRSVSAVLVAAEMTASEAFGR